jgi:hypothetical protein
VDKRRGLHMMIQGCVPCKNNKERKVVYKKIKSELGTKPEFLIWYDKNMLLYSYKSTRKEIFI